MRESPLVLHVINLESDVWGNIGGQIRAQVNSDNFRGWVDLPKVDAPDAAASANVEHSPRIADGREVELSIINNVKHCMHQVQSIELSLGVC